MANTDHKQGTYSIPANSSQQFTFWWGRDSKAPNEFFDVSIAPHHDKSHPQTWFKRAGRCTGTAAAASGSCCY
jgi:hypothetical protein